MTDKERAVIMAYTGIIMLTGDKFSIFHKYIEDILARPIWTHELANPSLFLVHDSRLSRVAVTGGSVMV